MKYLIWSKKHHSYWKQDRRGYVQSRKMAGRFPLEVAEQICMEANKFIRDDEEPEETMVPILEKGKEDFLVKDLIAEVAGTK